MTETIKPFTTTLQDTKTQLRQALAFAAQLGAAIGFKIDPEAVRMGKPTFVELAQKRSSMMEESGDVGIAYYALSEANEQLRRNMMFFINHAPQRSLEVFAREQGVASFHPKFKPAIVAAHKALSNAIADERGTREFRRRIFAVAYVVKTIKESKISNTRHILEHSAHSYAERQLREAQKREVRYATNPRPRGLRVEEPASV